MKKSWILWELSATYTQDSDGNDDHDLGQTLEVSSVNGGAGNYTVLKTDRWAVDEVSELMVILKDFESRTKGVGYEM